MEIVIAILIFLIAVLAYLFYAYNRLTQLRNTIETEWSQVDVLLRKRHDLIPNIIETVLGYATHEKDTLERASQARIEALRSDTKRGEGESDLSSHIATIFALRESYPDLKASQSFQELARELFSIEEAISIRRKNFNDIVKAFNDFILKFPANLVASGIGFDLQDLFQFNETRAVPGVYFEEP